MCERGIGVEERVFLSGWGIGIVCVGKRKGGIGWIMSVV